MLLGFAYRFHLPQIKTWALSSIQIYSYENLPVVIKPGDIDFSIFPLGIKITDTQITSSQGKMPELKKLIIKEINVLPDLVALSIGQARLSEIRIHDSRLVVVVPKSVKKPTADKKDFSLDDLKLPSRKEVLKILDLIPVDKLSIDRMNYYARYDDLKLSNLVTNISLNLTKYENNLFLDFDMPNFKLKETANDKSFLEFSIQSKIALSPNRVQLESLKVYQQDSFFDLQLNAENWLNNASRTFKTNLKSKLNLNDIRRLALRFNKEIEIPQLNGVLSTELKLDSAQLEQLNGNLGLTNFDIDGFKIGNLNTDFKAKQNEVLLSNFQLRRKLNNIKIPILKLNKTSDDKLLIDSDVKIVSLELRQLLRDIKVGDTPLRLDASSQDMKCGGEIQPKFSLVCKGNLKANYFRVFNPDNNFTIHSFENAEITGEVLINTLGVYPKGDIRLGDSTGKASGFIEYENGFKIDYESDNFDFKNIKSLADLKLSGKAKLKGNTKGGSQFATIDMDVNSNSIELFDYRLGNVKTKFRYESGNLYFNKLNSLKGRSRLKGKVAINLLDNTIKGNLSSRNAHLNDIAHMVEEHLKLPVSLSGKGNAYLSFSGPLEFNKMDYDLIYKSPSIRIDKESFEAVDVNLRTRKGFLKSRKLIARKGDAVITGNMSLNPDYDLDIKLNSKNLMLENINFTENLGGKITANANVSASVNGRIPDLNYSVDAGVKNLDIGGTNLNDSVITYEQTGNDHKVKANLFGNTLKMDSFIPQNKEKEFYLKLEAVDFNFTALFSLLGLNTSQIGFKSQLSANADLRSKTGGLWASTGNLTIESLSLERGPLSLRATSPLIVKARNGLFQSKKWKLKGDGTDITYQVNPTNGGKLNSTIQGTLNLALASFAVPFVDDLRGDVSLSTQLGGSIEKPILSGSALLKNAFFKIPNFPHPFERISSDITFNNNNIVLNKIEAELAGGKLLGNGNVQVLNFTNIPTKITGNLKGSKLQFIEGIELVSDGDFTLTGSWFPFLLKADARVTSGKISPDTTKNTGQKVRPSRYLPKILLKDNFDPITLDVKARIEEKVRINIPEVKSFIQGNMSLKGPVDALIYNGDVSFVPGGKLFFRDTPFNINTGRISFKDETSLNPLLFIDGSTSIVEQSSETNYDISLILQGRLDNFTTNIESQPNLSERDLISLLALGLTSEQLDKQTVENQQDLQMMELGAAVISSSPLGKEIEDRTGFTFKLSTDVDEEDATQYKVVISKQVTPKVGASASILGNNAKKDVKLEYKLNKGLSLIGSWESTTLDENDSDTSLNQNQKSDVFGLDLRYKVEFD